MAGMDTMREVLTILGFGPCQHMFEITGEDDGNGPNSLWMSAFSSSSGTQNLHLNERARHAPL